MSVCKYLAELRPGDAGVAAACAACRSWERGSAWQTAALRATPDGGSDQRPGRTPSILIVDDDPDQRELLEMLLDSEGFRVASVPAACAALDLLTQGSFRPDLVLADLRLGCEVDGLDLAESLREKLHQRLPVIILTGDISSETRTKVALQNCVLLHKPVTTTELTDVIQRLIPKVSTEEQPRERQLAEAVGGTGSPVVYVVEDDRLVREAMTSVLEADGATVEAFESSDAFLESYRPGREACLLIDAYLPGSSGFELLELLGRRGDRMPAIMIAGNDDVPVAVRAMKAGARDVLKKPVSAAELLASVDRTLEWMRELTKAGEQRDDAANHISGLTLRQRQIMDLVLAGHPSKKIAETLDVSRRTVETHRAKIRKKTGCRSLPALARLAFAAMTSAEDLGRHL